MKKYLATAIFFVLCFATSETNANHTSSTATAEVVYGEAMDFATPGDKTQKKHRKGTYGKKKGTKGSSCKRTKKIMNKRHR